MHSRPSHILIKIICFKVSNTCQNCEFWALDLSYPFDLTHFRSLYKTITNCTRCDYLQALISKRNVLGNKFFISSIEFLEKFGDMSSSLLYLSSQVL